MRTKKKALVIACMVGMLGVASSVGVCHYNQSQAKTKKMDVKMQVNQSKKTKNTDRCLDGASKKVEVNVDQDENDDYIVNVSPNDAKVTYDRDEANDELSVSIE